MPYTITFDEKFDLEEGELKFVSLTIYQDEDDWNGGDIWDSIEITSDVSDYGTIDNTSNVTVIENFEPEEGDYVYVQFGYFVSDELVKSTKLISLDEVSTTPTNISDIEYLCAMIEGPYASDSDGNGEVYGDVKILTILPGYDSYTDYDYSGIQIKARAGWGQFCPIESEYFSGEVIVNCNTDGTYSGSYTVSDSVTEKIENEEWWGSDSFTAEILNPNIIPKKFSLINYS